MESREKIVSLTAAFSLQLDPPPQGRLSHMQGVLIYARKPDGVYVRIKVMGFLGRLIFDMVHRSDEILVYVPSRKTLYRGQTDIGDKGDAASALFKAVLLDFGDVRVPPNAVLELDQDTVIVPLTEGKMIMKRDTGLLHEFHLGDEIVRYDEYQQESGLPPFPCRITVRQKDGMQFASCNLSQVRVNVEITDAFDLSVYQPKIIRDLGQLNMLETP